MIEKEKLDSYLDKPLDEQVLKELKDYIKNSYTSYQDLEELDRWLKENEDFCIKLMKLENSEPMTLLKSFKEWWGYDGFCVEEPRGIYPIL